MDIRKTQERLEDTSEFVAAGCDWLADLLSDETPTTQAAEQMSAMTAVEYEGRDASGRLS